MNPERPTAEALYAAYGQRVYNLARRALADPSEAEDLVQDTFLRVHAGLAGFRGEAAPSTWIYRIALNLIEDRNARAGREKAALLAAGGPADGQPMPEAVDGLDEAERAWLYAEVRREIRERCHAWLAFELTAAQRPAFLLRELLGLSYRDIADILGVAEDVVRARIKRARDRLARRLTTRCSWFNPAGSCSCQSKVAYVLRKYPGLIAKYTRDLPRERVRDLVGDSLAASPRSVDELFRNLPELAWKARPLFSEKT